MLKQATKADAQVSAAAGVPVGLASGVKYSTRYEVEAHDPQGNLIFRDEFQNLVVDEGLNDNLAKYFKGAAYTAAHFVGLTQGSPVFAAGNTLASHAGWTEQTGYNEEERQALVLGSVAAKQVSNSGSKAVFTITDNATTIGGAFLATDDTKGGTTGILYGGGAFSGGDVVLSAGSTLSVTVTLTASAA